MLKRVLVLFSFAFIRQINTQINPRSLIDDAKALLQNLTDLTLGDILVAHDQLNDLGTNVLTFGVDVQLKSELDIQEGHQAVNQELTNLKNLAQAAGKDISECLEGYEHDLNSLPEVFRNQIKKCIAETKLESDDVLNQAFYNIDIFMNTVHDLNFQLGRCSDDDTDCISKVMDQINASIKNIPTQIQLEVNKATEKVEEVKVEIQKCADLGLAGFVQNTTDILSVVTECVNKIIS